MLKRIREMSYVILLCDDFKQMCEFYTRVMGFPVFREFDNWLELLVGSTLLTLRPRGREYDGTSTPGASLQLAFRVSPDEVFTCHDELLEKGVKILATPTDTHFGHRTLFFTDPENNILEIYAEIPVKTEHILSHLSVEQILEISPHCDLQEYAPGEIIVRQGDEADKFYVIVSGRVQVINHTDKGQDLHIGWLHDGEYFGEVGLLQSHPRTATIRAANNDRPVKVIAIDREGFTELLHESEITSEDLSKAMLERLMEMAGKIIVAS